ncbi:MAG TPA: T9SS type A sorting domain-containing protein [Phaeodactylibacter sp.]|nr:T9SS type A sorting domain-containing protein [Phaeodactylibacter sp.]
MKRKLPFLFILFLTSSWLSAQIVVTSATFPEPGDTLRTVLDALPGDIDLLEPGVDKNWDFSNLSGINQETVIKAAVEGDYFDQFPSAEVMVSTAGGNIGELYYNVTNNLYELLGYIGPDPANFGINLLARMVPPSAERRAPMEFFDVHTSESNIQVAFSTELIPSTILDSLPVSPDSMRFRIAINRLDVVDAWGDLAIPGGTYEVLREERFEERETRMDVLVGIGPFSEWMDITDLVGFDFLGKDTILTYNFFSDDAKEIIASVRVNPVTETPVSVTYKYNMADPSISATHYLDQGISDIFAYPNPAINEVRFDFINLPTDTYDLKIFNILGLEVFHKRYKINDRLTVKMDLSDMRKGTYLYSLINSEGKTISTKRLVVLKP